MGGHEGNTESVPKRCLFLLTLITTVYGLIILMDNWPPESSSASLKPSGSLQNFLVKLDNWYATEINVDHHDDDTEHHDNHGGDDHHSLDDSSHESSSREKPRVAIEKKSLPAAQPPSKERPLSSESKTRGDMSSESNDKSQERKNKPVVADLPKLRTKSPERKVPVVVKPSSPEVLTEADMMTLMSDEGDEDLDELLKKYL